MLFIDMEKNGVGIYFRENFFRYVKVKIFVRY